MANELGIFSVDNLNMTTIKQYLDGGGKASDEELVLLINLCKQNMVIWFSQRSHQRRLPPDVI